ncbi:MULTISPECIES: F0F1 ATP synthase subunit delta [unclassified Pseudactinotalea]|uniref:F0F1 ATP synthase subunit delta n=1 Tax=unclassified Pseudactinotalea TaxID=2649176 RepID=UPI00128C2675|nr:MULTISPECIES: F0F1 ATP synthase subunit delta [unclassified Pseudactinotalea]MPV48916.1 F0F1 ATP synthase subunit delta [Pseudactinotalea sp. HY160]QGH68893.1 F0F1 ATP synthase subunit delta [Pseudactinotalea sp. HY158]
MRATSSASLAAAAGRWEPVVTGAGPQAADYGRQLFAVVDVLDSSAGLRRALTEPTREGEAKARLVTDVFGATVAEPVADLIAGLARDRWSDERDLTDAVEELAITSLLVAADSRDGIADLEEDVFRIVRLLAEERELRLSLSNRDLPAERRVDLVRSVFGERIGSEAFDLVSRVVAAPRGRTLTAGLMRVAEHAATRRNRLLAVVTAAVPLSRAQQDRLGAMLSSAYGRTMQVNVAVDPALVGGLRIQVGDELVDATVLTRLDEARRRLAG